jgi:hypothetical protein
MLAKAAGSFSNCEVNLKIDSLTHCITNALDKEQVCRFVRWYEQSDIQVRYIHI